MTKLRISQRLVDDILVLLMFCISGNPAFNSAPGFGKIVNIVMLGLILIVSGLRIKTKALKESAFWLILLSIIFLVQYLTLGEITVFGSLNFATKMLCAILLASYVGPRLPATAIRVMSGICAVSLVFYLINLTGVRFTSPLHLDTKTEPLIIYTQSWDDPYHQAIFRNSGMFWEPGAFAGYIIATLLLFIDRPRLLWHKFKWHSILLFVALLTTTSTTGYIAFAVLLFFFILRWNAKGKGKIYAHVAATLLVILAVLAFFKVDFLGQKIQRELQMTERQTDADVNVSRSGSILFDIQYIVTHPVFGNGLSDNTRFRYHIGTYDKEDLEGFGNGFSGCIASMGLLFMLVYLISIGRNRTLRSKGMVILLVILLLQGEYFLNYPWFMMFPFIQFGKEAITPRKKHNAIKLVWNKTEKPVSQS